MQPFHGCILCFLYLHEITFKANWNIRVSPKICKTIICKQKILRSRLPCLLPQELLLYCLRMLALPVFTLHKFFFKDRLEELKVRIFTFIQWSGLFICHYLSIDYVESLSTKVLHQKKNLLTWRGFVETVETISPWFVCRLRRI